MSSHERERYRSARYSMTRHCPLHLVQLILRCMACVCSIAAQNVAAAPILTACASNVDYPPYLYETGSTMNGVVVDILRHIWPSVHADLIAVRKLPWKRCLKLAELGQIDLVVNVPTAQIDPAPFHITEAYAQLHSVYFVAKAHWPRGIVIASLQDLRSFRVCGLMGNRYDSYGLLTEAVDRGANNYRSLIGKLEAGYCDMFIEKREVIAGLLKFDEQLARQFASASLLVRNLPEDSPIGLHFAVSKLSASHNMALEKLNMGIAQLTRRGIIARWEKRHMSPDVNKTPARRADAQ